MPAGISHSSGSTNSVIYLLEFDSAFGPHHCCSNLCSAACSSLPVLLGGGVGGGRARTETETAATTTMPIIAYTIIFFDEELEPREDLGTKRENRFPSYISNAIWNR